MTEKYQPGQIRAEDMKNSVPASISLSDSMESFHEASFQYYFRPLLTSLRRLEHRIQLGPTYFSTRKDGEALHIHTLMIPEWRTKRYLHDAMVLIGMTPGSSHTVGAHFLQIEYSDEANKVGNWIATRKPGLGVGKALVSASDHVLQSLADTRKIRLDHDIVDQNSEFVQANQHADLAADLQNVHHRWQTLFPDKRKVVNPQSTPTKLVTDTHIVPAYFNISHGEDGLQRFTRFQPSQTLNRAHVLTFINSTG